VKNSTWIHDVWGGQVRSRVICKKCEKPSDTFDEVLDFSLDVNKGGKPKLQSMLQGYVKEDKLEGDNKYNCEK
jgi:ubiquitin C-terminal hydrolase